MMDKVTSDIIWGKLQATSDEMGVILAKASMSPVIYEVLEFACEEYPNISGLLIIYLSFLRY